MEAPVPRPDVNRVLARLKDFQRDTVDYVFRRMYEDHDCVTRFLVADEVGLGKTMVAGGVIARAVDHLWERVGRIDVVYVCSNAGIARQNVNRIQKLLGGHAAVLPSRLTLLPRVVRGLAKCPLNLVAFTPGTSFDLRSSLGTADERALLYWLLPDSWRRSERGAISLLTGTAGRAGFKARVNEYRGRFPIDEGLRNQFRASLEAAATAQLKARFLALADDLGGRALQLSDAEWRERSAIVSELRGVLAASCIESLEPDLIVLDEFQRFKHLLNAEDEASELARRLFDYRDRNTGQHARVLLLSATPYKMHTLADEIEAEDHFSDFISTVGFLQNNVKRTDAFRCSLTGYRKALFQFTPGVDNDLGTRKRAIEEELRQVMVRTERLSVRADRNGMLVEVAPSHMRLDAADVEGYLAVQQVGQVLGQGDTLEYWKSASYLLNFMEDYQLKRDFKDALRGPDGKAIYQALAAGSGALLSWDDVQAYRRVDLGNARLRSLMADLDAHEAWRMFWLPPALPYYGLVNDFAGADRLTFTKRLVFSSWQVVPKVVAALLSYEVERRLQGAPEEGKTNANTIDERRKQKPLLRFSRSEGRPTGMPVLALLYASPTLARATDPFIISGQLRSSGDSEVSPTLEEVLSVARVEIERLLSQLPAGTDAGAEDESWYWAAPILLDLKHDRESTDRWFGQHDLKVRWREGASTADVDEPIPGEEVEEPEDEAWSSHVDQAHALRSGRLSLGRRPDDLASVLALMAVAGPSHVALRAIARVTGGIANVSSSELRNAAGRVAEGFRSLFNHSDVTTYIRRTQPTDKAYWRSVLDYSASGCLQAVMDEYAHTSLELTGAPRNRQAAGEIAKEMIIALTLRTVNLGVDVIRLDPGARQLRVDPEPRGFRARFALRFGERKGEDGASGARQDAVRKAFNSPFWPFVLCSTSVGQEGLDFHPYCHAIVHWNLPANPVDLEQREGRIHRYKGHAVRKNLAQRHGASVLRETACADDPWNELFRRGLGDRSESDRELVPFWVYATKNGARIERHIPTLPLSRDVERAHLLRRALVVYRMAFGQSRQDDLLAYLTSRIPPDAIESVAEDLRIDLSPPRTTIQWPAVAGSDDVESAAGSIDLMEDDGQRRAIAWNPNLDDLAKLLDRARALAAGEGVSHDLDALRELLDRASVLVREQQPVVDVDALRALLDRFASLESLTRAPGEPADWKTT
jgi:hypothetical protein